MWGIDLLFIVTSQQQIKQELKSGSIGITNRKMNMHFEC